MNIKVEEIYQRKNMEDKRKKIRLEEQSLGPTFKCYEFQKENRENRKEIPPHGNPGLLS